MPEEFLSQRVAG